MQSQLPRPPATVLEIGCGPLGGFVPTLNDGGYRAVGVDPAAPDGPEYERAPFEELDTPEPFDAVVACTSLHHVDDLDAIVERIGLALRSGGTIVVVEWAWEQFDDRTAHWCFERLTPNDSGTGPTWLHRHREAWQASGRSWDTYLRGWASEHRLHPAAKIHSALDTRFERTSLEEAPYFFSDLDETSEHDEQVAIDAGEIQATGVHYAGTNL